MAGLDTSGGILLRWADSKLVVNRGQAFTPNGVFLTFESPGNIVNGSVFQFAVNSVSNILVVLNQISLGSNFVSVGGSLNGDAGKPSLSLTLNFEPGFYDAFLLRDGAVIKRIVMQVI
jgi:hypothetical protein